MNEPTFKGFDSKVMLDNVSKLQLLIQRVRQNESVGSDADELVIHRSIQDLDMLLDIISGLRAHTDQLDQKHERALSQIKQLEQLCDRYEEMLETRNETIKQLEKREE